MATVPDDGLEILAKQLCGITTDPVTKMATGSSSTAESTSDNQLGSENSGNGSDRATADAITYEATGVSKWVHQFDFTGAVTVREIGLFDSAGNLFMRHVLTADKAYVSGESLEITLTNTTQRSS
jgi:hypothetical protein